MKGHTLPGINQRSDEKVDLTVKPNPTVASKASVEDYNQSEAEQEKESDEETERINKPPATKPPTITDPDTILRKIKYGKSQLELKQ
tara:strand:+ start:330 stop:590 length:261 start_codon:yes stop_codon:yes gene_type:complete